MSGPPADAARTPPHRDAIIAVELHPGPLPRAAAAADRSALHSLLGASLVFEGVVRGHELGRQIRGLRYEAHEPMTSAELRRLACDIAHRHGVLAVTAAHSVGVVPVGEVSFRLHIAAAHRAESLAAMADFIDQMKQHVPLWKMPLFADETHA